MYFTLKTIHLGTAALTICGFLLRGYWMVREPEWLEHRLVRILPHVNDTLFLLSGIGLVVTLQLPVLTQPWLLAKILGLVLYVVLGTIALKRGRTRRQRVTALILAVLTFAYIAGAAWTKSAWSWMAMVATISSLA